jgi:GNAT superfamily N-acetyltransferase
MKLRLRNAETPDYPAFARLMPELAVDDPTPPPERWERELLPTTIIAEDEAGRVVGYAFFHVLSKMVHVRHLVTAPEARRAGVGQALLGAAVERAHAAGCTTWCLNVMASNTAAQRLYEKVGLRRAHSSHPLNLRWSIVDAADTSHAEGLSVWPIGPEHDGRVERETPLTPGLLALGRERGRVMLALEKDGRIEGATIFDPSFPGAYPFHAARPELAFVLLKPLLPYKRPSDEKLAVVIENHPPLAEALIAAGATLKFEIIHMKGPLPGASSR